MSGAQTPLRNPRLEKVAQELAKLRSPVEASRAAGYPNGSSFDSNARKRAQHPQVKARVAVLQGKAAELVVCDVAYVQRKLVEIVDTNFDPKEIGTTDRLKAMDMILKILGGYAPEKVDARAAIMTMAGAPATAVSDSARLSAVTSLIEKMKASEAA